MILYTENRTTLYVIAVGMVDHVEVFGDPDSVSYEWLIRTPAGVRECSNDGYGIAEVALRDGLITYFGAS